MPQHSAKRQSAERFWAQLYCSSEFHTFLLDVILLKILAPEETMDKEKNKNKQASQVNLHNLE
jgi:hypothetical protein